jgi:hypothetical protein
MLDFGTISTTHGLIGLDVPDHKTKAPMTTFVTLAIHPQELSKGSVCVCVCERERERERWIAISNLNFEQAL